MITEKKRNSEDVWVKHSFSDHGQKWSLVKKAYLLGSWWSLECRNCANTVCVTRRCLTAVCCFCILIQSVGKVRTYLFSIFRGRNWKAFQRPNGTAMYGKKSKYQTQVNIKSNFLRPGCQLKKTTADILTWNIHWLGQYELPFLNGSVTVLSKINLPWAST